MSQQIRDQEQAKMELRPSSLRTDVDQKSPKSSSHTTMIRRRNNIAPQNVAQFSNSIQKSIEEQTTTASTTATTMTATNDDEQRAMKEQIFSITATSFVLIASLFIGVCWLGLFEQNVFLVSAYSDKPIYVEGQQQTGSSASPTEETGAGGAGGNGGASRARQGGSGNAQKVQTSFMGSPKSLLLEERRLRQSIDRFDSGEQIRAPLLRSPTTVAPLPATVATNRASEKADEAYNLQAAASQDSYLTPQERDQMMRHQENHYEGRNSDQQPAVGFESSSQQYSQVAPSGQQPRPSATNVRPNSDEEADYQDGPDERESPNLVPERRRAPMLAGSANYNQQDYRTEPPMANLDEAADSGASDDYTGGGNDDAFFSRKSPEASLKQAASSAGYRHASSANRMRQSTNEDSRKEPQGFGPGPNEAYLQDKAESSNGAPISDQDEPAGDFSGPEHGSGESSQMGGEFDSRPAQSRHQQRQRAPLSGASSEQDSDSQADNSNSNNNNNEDDDDSGSAFSPSSPRAVKTASHRMVSRHSLAAVPVAGSQSAMAPLAAPRAAAPIQQASQQQQQAVQQLNWAQPIKQPVQQQQQQQLYRHPIHVDRAVFSASNQHQSQSASAPYNPQNNPSHAGKYFIN